MKSSTLALTRAPLSGNDECNSTPVPVQAEFEFLYDLNPRPLLGLHFAHQFDLIFDSEPGEGEQQ